MSITYSFFDATTGLLNGTKFVSSNPEMIKQNTPNGSVSIEGSLDHLSQRVDLNVLRQIESLNVETDAEQIANLRTRLVIDYQPASPGDDHEWIGGDTKRWQVKPDIAKKRATVASAHAEINKLESSQLRAIRELALDANNQQAKDRLASIDQQIALQRQLMQLNQ